MKKLSEMFKEVVEARKTRECKVEHPEWSPMDDVVVKSFIPDALRRVYWHTKRGALREAYIAAGEALPRIRYEPFMWRLPEQMRVSRDVIVSTVELLQMAEEARGKWLAAVR